MRPISIEVAADSPQSTVIASESPDRRSRPRPTPAGGLQIGVVCANGHFNVTFVAAGGNGQREQLASLTGAGSCSYCGGGLKGRPLQERVTG